MIRGISGQTVLLFNRHIRIAHRSCSDRIALSHPLKSLSQQFVRIDFNYDFIIKMVHMVALTSGIAVDAVMLTAAIDVHAVLHAEPGRRLACPVDDRFGFNLLDQIITSNWWSSGSFEFIKATETVSQGFQILDDIIQSLCIRFRNRMKQDDGTIVVVVHDMIVGPLFSRLVID